MPEIIRRDGLSLSLVITALSGVLFLVAFSSADWVVREYPPHRFGIWSACREDLGERNCTRIEESPGLAELYATKDLKACDDRPLIICGDTLMSFVYTVQVFDCITLIFWLASLVFYIVCMVKYNAWFISMACGFQFFGGLMCLTACLEWGNNFHKAAKALRWAFYLNGLSGSVMVANGILFSLLVCSGTCMRPPSTLGIVFRGNADAEYKHVLKNKGNSKGGGGNSKTSKSDDVTFVEA